MSSTITPVTSNAGSMYATDALSGSAKSLDQNDFLKLLVTQIQYQDPMNPKSDTDMASQMAQFTSLQQSSQMSSSLSMMQANSLVGSLVSLQVDSKTQTSGLVSGVTMNNGKPQIMVGGTAYDVSQVIAVAPAPATTTSTTTGTSTTANQTN